MPLYLWNGKLLSKDGKLASNQNCCCSSSSSSSGDSTSSGEGPFDPGPFSINNFDQIYAEHTRKLKP